ncbi:hypothetical protein F4703DRAFT_1221938 [Phycomyces blakesleeanus]
MSLNSGLPTGRYERVQPSSTSSIYYKQFIYMVFTTKQPLKAFYQRLSSIPPLEHDSPASSPYESKYAVELEDHKQLIKYNPNDIHTLKYTSNGLPLPNSSTLSPKPLNEYVCLDCYYRTSKKYNFDRHMGIHKGKRSVYSCGKCQRSYTTKYNLSRHIGQSKCR